MSADRKGEPTGLGKVIVLKVPEGAEGDFALMIMRVLLDKPKSVAGKLRDSARLLDLEAMSKPYCEAPTHEGNLVAMGYNAALRDIAGEEK